MTSVLALSRIEEIRGILPGELLTIRDVLKGMDSDGPLTARVMVWEHGRQPDKCFLLTFSTTELYRRFGKLPWKLQERLASALYYWATQIKERNTDSGSVSSNLSMEVEFGWSSSKRRRLRVNVEREQRSAGQQQPYQNIFLHLDLI